VTEKTEQRVGGMSFGDESGGDVSTKTTKGSSKASNFVVGSSRGLQEISVAFSDLPKQPGSGSPTTTNCDCVLARQKADVRFRKIGSHLKAFLDEVIIPTLVRESLADFQRENLIERQRLGMEDGRCTVQVPPETSR